MPSAPLRVCAAPRCPNRVEKGYCLDHQRTQKVQHSRFYTGGGFYGRRWRQARAAFLAAHPYCVCGCGQLADVVDHRIPHRGNHDLFWDERNWQPMTKACHDAKTAREVWHEKA